MICKLCPDDDIRGKVEHPTETDDTARDDREELRNLADGIPYHEHNLRRPLKHESGEKGRHYLCTAVASLDLGVYQLRRSTNPDPDGSV